MNEVEKRVLFEQWWQSIEAELFSSLFMIEHSENIKNLCWLTWLEASK